MLLFLLPTRSKICNYKCYCCSLVGKNNESIVNCIFYLTKKK